MKYLYYSITHYSINALLVLNNLNRTLKSMKAHRSWDSAQKSHSWEQTGLGLCCQQLEQQRPPAPTMQLTLQLWDWNTPLAIRLQGGHMVPFSTLAASVLMDSKDSGSHNGCVLLKSSLLFWS